MRPAPRRAPEPGASAAVSGRRHVAPAGRGGAGGPPVPRLSAAPARPGPPGAPPAPTGRNPGPTMPRGGPPSAPAPPAPRGAACPGQQPPPPPGAPPGAGLGAEPPPRAPGRSRLPRAPPAAAEGPPAAAERGEERPRAPEQREAVEPSPPGAGAAAAGSGSSPGTPSAALRCSVPAGPPEEPAGPAGLISFEEALQHFRSAELARGQKATEGRTRRRGLAALLRVLCGPPRLRAPLRPERDLALAIARCALDGRDRVHVRILQTIYGGLTRSALACPRYGAHWEELGFQGADPGTDLRGAGMLGLLHMLHLVTDARTLPLALGIFRLSRHESQGFPFGLVSLNVTRIVLRALRDGRLSRECNRRREVLAVLNDAYAAALVRLGSAWAARRGAAPDAGALLQELETFTLRRPKQLLKSLESPVSRGEGRAPEPAAQHRGGDFTGVWELPPEPPGAARPL